MHPGRRCSRFLLLVLLPYMRAQSPDTVDFFESRIRPILVNNCFACHTESKLGGLRMDSKAALLKGGKSGPAISPGKPEDSLLVRAISHTDPKLKMPMGGRLSDSEIRDLKEWVRMGIPWPEAATSPPVTVGSGI